MNRKNSIARVLIPVFWLAVLIVSFVFIRASLAQEEAFRQYDPDPETMMNEESRTLNRTRGEMNLRGEGMPDAQPTDQPPTIMVKTGERVFCAMCGRKLDDTVHFEEVLLEQAGGYYDDGSHNDEVPRDGLPSNIIEVRTSYIGPYCGLLRDRLLSYWVKVKNPQTWGYYRSASYPRHWAAVAFYGLPVAALDRVKAESPLEPLTRWSQQLEEYVAFWHSFYVQPYFQYEIHPDNLAGPQMMRRGPMMWGMESPEMMMMMQEEGFYGPEDFNPQSHPTADKINRANRAADMMK
ncbi:MAG TPA: hypothetical protein PKH07_05940 [bacterium]|nr:hypothetical protein [bacterium]